jgi:transmembrane sensor
MTHEEVTAQAVEWLVELQRREVREGTVAAWQEWLAADDRHRQAFDRLQGIQDRIACAPSLPWPTDEEIARDGAQAARSRVRRISLAMAASLLAALGALGYWQFATRPAEIATAVAELRRVPLADGSIATLGSGSLIAVEMTEAARIVTLSQGEAYFEVANDPSRPFTVHAGSTAITAIGTAFDVRRAGDRVTVTVSEGEVRVTSEERPPVSLSAGQQVHLSPARVSPKVALAPQAIAGWRKGHREYVAEPLAGVIADIGRYSDRKIVIDDPGAGEIAITGTIIEKDFERWLRSLPTALPVEVRSDPEGTIHIRSRTGP